MAHYNKITTEEINIIVSKKHTAKELTKILNRHYYTIAKIARKYKTILPKPKPNRKYHLNEAFFESWTIESAYLLGFLMADGCILLYPRNGGVVSITLQDRDVEILNNIQKILNSNYPIRKKTIKNKNYVRLDLCSAKMCNDLIKMGCIPSKTRRLKFPQIPENLVNHFIRGYFDGDGHIKILKNNTSPNQYLRIQFTGRHNFIQALKEQINSHLKINNGYICKLKNQNCSHLVYNGIKLPILVGKFIFSNLTSTTKLDRKLNVFKDFLKLSQQL